MIKLTPLYSGSNGNCTLVETRESKIIIDAGFTYAKSLKFFKHVGLTPRDINGILVTHEHSDHIRALEGWAQFNPDIPIFAHEDIAEYIGTVTGSENVVPFKGAFPFRDVEIEVFDCSHDARRCCGFRFYDGEGYSASVTDTGKVTKGLEEFLAPCRTVIIESNHDVGMLIRGSYPFKLKERILSDYGHLSNAQTANLIGALLEKGRIVNIVLAHLSEKNNTHELAFASAVNAVETKGLTEGRDVFVYVASQYGGGTGVE